MALEDLRRWHSRKIGKPYEIEDGVYINVYSPVLERGLDDRAYSSEALINSAASLIADYYGKKVEVISSENRALEGAGIHFPTRALSNPIVRYVTPKVTVEDLLDLKVNLDEGEILIDVANIKPFLTHIGTAFKVYQQQLKFFDGSISPNINFLDLLDKVKLFFNNLENFVSFNNYELSKYQSINIPIGESYQINRAYLVDHNLKQWPLPKGIKYYFSTLKQGSNKYVNELVGNFNNILVGKRSQLNWTQFIYNFLSESDITINHYGRPRSSTEPSKVEAQTNAGPFGPLAASFESAAAEMALKKPPLQVMQKAFDEAQREYTKIQEPLQKRLNDIVEKIQEITDEVNKVGEILTKYNIMTLIEAALECLLFKQGFNGTVPDFIPGLDPFDPTPPQIALRFPELPIPKWPVISINKEFLLSIREALKKAAMDAMMAALGAIADIIRELCLTDAATNDTDSNWEPLDLVRDPNALYDCYADFGFTPPTGATVGMLTPTAFSAETGRPTQWSGDALEQFLAALSPLITAREQCDLFNGIARGEVFQVINNLIDSEWTMMRDPFPDSEALEQFFLCIGNLIDPSYCVDVYNALVPDLPTSVDPCTIEDTQPFQDLIELLDGIKEAIDTSCGGPILPALADIATYNQAVTQLIGSILAPTQQIFVNDLGNFKSTVIQAQPLSQADTKELERSRALLEWMQEPEEPSPPLTPDERARGFLTNMIPDAIQEGISDMRAIGRTLSNIGGGGQDSIQQTIKNILASQTYLVAPKTKNFYENIESEFLTSKLLDDDGNPLNLSDAEAARYYAFMTNIPYEPSTSLYAPGETEGLSTVGRLITYVVGGGPPDEVNIYEPSLFPAQSTWVQRDLDISLGGATGSPSSDGEAFIVSRRLEAEEFAKQILKYALQKLSGEGLAASQSVFVKKFYPFMYFSLINLCAYRISNSDLFETSKMRSLNLFPKVCADGSLSNSDLLDINKIKQEALEEFVNNSCLDGNYELGPVRDAGILALVSAYMQVLIVDMLLKNIFMVDKFGIEYITGGDQEPQSDLDWTIWSGRASGWSVVNELQSQMLNRIVEWGGGSVIRPVFPEIVSQAAAIAVKSIIKRDPQSFAYPLSGQPFTAEQQDVLDNIEDTNIDSGLLQQIAVRYFFEKRLIGTTEKIKDFFKVEGDTPVETFILNGMVHTELTDFQHITNTVDPSELRVVGAPDSAGVAQSGADIGGGYDFDNDGVRDYFGVPLRYLWAATDESETWDPESGPDRIRRLFYIVFNYILGEPSSLLARYLSNLEGFFGEGFISSVTVTTSPPEPPDPGAEQLAEEFFDYETGQTQGDTSTTTYFTPPPTTEHISKEIDAYLKYGSLVAERHFRVEYSPSRLEEAAAAMEETWESNEGEPLLLEVYLRGIQEALKFFEDHTPIPEQASTPGAPTDTDTYLLSFDAFKDLFSMLGPWLSTGPGNLPYNLPIPFYLAGYTYTRSKEPIVAYIETGNPEYQSQDRLHMSDYDLIRIWKKQVESLRFSVGGDRISEVPMYESDPQPAEHDPGISLYSLNNAGYATVWVDDPSNPAPAQIESDISTQGLTELPYMNQETEHKNLLGPNQSGLVYQGTWDPASQGYAGQRVVAMPQDWPWIVDPPNHAYSPGGDYESWVDGWDAFHVPGNYLLNWKLFNGVNFGGYTFDTNNDEWGQWVQDPAGTPSGREILAESKNFRIWVNHFGSTVDDLPTSEDPFALMFRTKPYGTFIYIEKKGIDYTGADDNDQGGTGGVYSSIDFYRGSSETINGQQTENIDEENYTLMSDLFDVYESESDLMEAIGLLNTNPLVPAPIGGGPPVAQAEIELDEPTMQQDLSIVAQYLKEAFLSIQMGSRLAYITPLQPAEFWQTSVLTHLLRGPQINVDAYKSFYLSPGAPGAFAHIATDRNTYLDVRDRLFDPVAVETSLRSSGGAGNGYERYIDRIYRDEQLTIAKGLATVSHDIFGPNNMVDIGKILQYLYITGEIKTYYSLFSEEVLHEAVPGVQRRTRGPIDIFSDTKQSLLLAIQAAMAGSDTTATSNCDMDAIQNTMLDGLDRTLAPFGEMGKSFANKMLVETPKYILKGVVEMVEPHVIVASNIKKVSKAIFDVLDQVLGAAQSAEDLASGFSGAGGGFAAARPSACDEELGVVQGDVSIPSIPDIPIPSLDEVLEEINSFIDSNWPDEFPDLMKPRVDKKGIDLEGSLPYTIFIPPLTPFGIIYLLLRLSELLGQGELEIAECE